MTQLLEGETILRKFLLGELPRHEQGEVEERLFSDTEFFKQFRAAEDELIDEYLYGDLTASERESFRQFFLTTPERRESLRVARALKEYSAKKFSAAAARDEAAADAPRPAKKSILDILGLRGPALRFAAAAALLLVASVAAWIIMRGGVRPAPSQESEGRPQAKVEDARPAPSQMAQADPPRGVDQPGRVLTAPPTPTPRAAPPGVARNGNVKVSRPPRPSPAGVYSFLLLPLGQVRGGGGANEVSLPPDARTVDLQIPLIEEVGYRRYQVALQTDDGAAVTSWNSLRPVQGEAGPVVSVTIPAASLGPQKYRLVLSGASGGGTPRVIRTFHFRVTK